MSIDILMPALSPTMESGKLSRWLKNVGDRVSAGDVIAEIETDKATMEVEAVDEGILAVQMVGAGAENVPVNSLIARLAEEGEDVSDVSQSADGPKPEAPSTVATSSAPSAATVEVAVASIAATKSGHEGRVKASPLARRIAKMNNIDLAQIQGSGPNGRIIKEDVETAQTKSSTQPPKQVVNPQPAAGMVPKASAEPEIMPLDGMRKTIAVRLTEAKQTVPHFYLTIDCRLDDLLSARKNMNAHLDGVKISVNDFIIKAMALALRDVPDANAQWGGDHIIKLKQSDVAVAVAIEGGLFTPVIRAAEGKGLKQISQEMKSLAELARNRRLTPDQYAGGSTSISNLGMFGVKNFQAVINPPQATILAVGGGEERLIPVNGQPVVANMMTVTLSCDHRVVDGALGAQLLQAFKHYIETPVALAL